MEQAQPLIVPQKPKFKWPFAIFFISVHLAALALAPFFFTWQALVVALVLHFIIGSLGTSLGYHRMFTHSTFSVPKWFGYVLGTLGVLALEGGPISWVGMHRAHHTYSDTDLDPHSARKGFWWSHAGWMFFFTQRAYRDLAPKFMKESRFYRFIDKHYLLPQLPLALALYFLGGWPFVVYGVLVRIVLLWHSTWLVNSATHKFGYRNYEINDLSRNTWWVALITWGEGWHNNHHAQQWSAKFSRKFWEIDVAWWIIRLLRAVRLARNVRVASMSSTLSL